MSGRSATLILAAAWLAVCHAAAAVAQPPRGGEDQRGDMLKSWDADGDGYLTDNEIPERARCFVRRAAERAGVSAEGRVSIDALLGARSNAEAAGSESGPADGRGTEQGSSPPGALGFGAAAERPQPTGFGAPSANRAVDFTAKKPGDEASNEALDRARRYARGLLDRYDANRNRVLERDEWSRIRGDPAKSDGNRDGVITYDELVHRLSTYRPQASGTSSPASGTTPARDRERRPSSDRAEANTGDQDERRSYRFKPAAERLPEGLPSWFQQRDANGDGQVAMHEYSRDWSDRRVRDFLRYDADNDGFITPAETKPKGR